MKVWRLLSKQKGIQMSNIFAQQEKLPFELSWKNGILQYRNLILIYIFNICAMALFYAAIRASNTWLGAYLLSLSTSLLSAEASMLFVWKIWNRILMKHEIKKDREPKGITVAYSFRMEAFLFVPISIGLFFVIVHAFVIDFPLIGDFVGRSAKNRLAIDCLVGVLGYFVFTVIKRLITTAALRMLKEYASVIGQSSLDQQGSASSIHG